MNPEATDAPSRPGLDVRVSVNSAVALPEAAMSSLSDLVRHRAMELLADMGVDADIEVAVDRVPRNPESVRVYINGIGCRVERRPSLPAGAPVGAIAERVANTLYWNRFLLVAPEVLARAQRGREAADDGGHIPMQAETLRALATELVADGFSLPTALALINGWPGRFESEPARDYWLQAAASHRSIRRIQLRAAPALMSELTSGAGRSEEFQRKLGILREGMCYELGIQFPQLELYSDEELTSRQFRLRINELRGPVQTTLAVDKAMVDATRSELHETGIDIDARDTSNPANQRAASIIRLRDTHVCENAGRTTWDAAGYLVLILSQQMRRHAATLLNMGVVEQALVHFDKSFPMVVFNVLERFGLTEVRALLTGLVDEGVSIRDLRSVLEALLEINGVTTDCAGDTTEIVPRSSRLCSSRATPPASADYIEYVRGALRRQITFQHAGVGNVLPAFETSREIEQRLGDDAATVSDEDRDRLVESIAAAMAEHSVEGPGPVLLTAPAARRPLRRLIELELPMLPVLATCEIASGVQVQRLRTIAWPPASADQDRTSANGHGSVT